MTGEDTIKPEEQTTPPITEIPAQSETVVESAPVDLSKELPTQPEPIPEPTISSSAPSPSPTPSASDGTVKAMEGTAKSFLAKALESIQFRKKAKLEKMMKLANEKKMITNDEVQKLIRVSDATATRYLSALVKQNKLKISGNRRSARYEPINGSNGGN